MPYEPIQVIEAVNRHWSSERRGRLLGPVIDGRGYGSWASEMQSRVKDIEKILREHLTASPDECADAVTLRKHCSAIQSAIREASHWPYRKAIPLFVSEWFVTSVLDPGKLHQLVKEERDYTGEHVIPLNSTVSGMQLLAKPARYMPQLARAMTAPMCEVIGYEDRRILRLRSLNPNLPFQRYSEPYRGEPIEVYRTTDGQRIEPASYSWRSWRSDMLMVPLYRDGLLFSDRLAEHWAQMLEPGLVRLMTNADAAHDKIGESGDTADQPDQELAAPGVVVGARGEELNAIEANLLQLLRTAEVPLTHQGFPRLRLPVRCSRVSVVLRAHDGQDLLTLTIGPERRKLDLYHCSGRGGAHVRSGEQVIARVHAALVRLFPNTSFAPLPSAYPKSSCGYRILYSVEPTVEATIDLARQCIEAMLHVFRDEGHSPEGGL